MTPARFRSIRETLELTQAELAAVMGYSGQPSISEIERGLKVPGQAARLLEAYLGGWRPTDWPPGRKPAQTKECTP